MTSEFHIQSDDTCLQCGTMVGNWTLHRAVCTEEYLHNYRPQWGRCIICGFAWEASCHDHSEPRRGQ